MSERGIDFTAKLAAAQITPDKPLYAVLTETHDAVLSMRHACAEMSKAADAARPILSPDAERDLVSSIARQVRVHLAAARPSPLQQFTRRPWLIAAGVVAALLAGWAVYATGRTHGADARLSELCRGSALQTKPGGGTVCSFPVVLPAASGG